MMPKISIEDLMNNEFEIQAEMRGIDLREIDKRYNNSSKHEFVIREKIHKRGENDLCRIMKIKRRR